MTSIYYPVLQAKNGELTALANLSGAVSQRIHPIFEVAPLSEQDLKAKKRRTAATPHRDNLDQVIANILLVRQGLPVSVDISRWKPNACVEGGEHVLQYVAQGLASGGALVCPVIGFDRWDDPEYRAAIANISLPGSCFFVIRIDKTSLGDIKDEEFLEDQLASIFETTGLAPSQFAILLDLGDVTGSSVDDIQSQSEGALERLNDKGFLFHCMIGASLPPSIQLAVSEVNSEGHVLRKEVIAWKALTQSAVGETLRFGDYGVRNPLAADHPSPHTNGKIRYTSGHNYFIARGHSMQWDDKGGQYHGLAAKVIASKHFKGAGYSWGDDRIIACSQGEFKGSSTDWIAIDTNHHIVAVAADVTVHSAPIASKKVTAN